MAHAHATAATDEAGAAPKAIRKAMPIRLFDVSIAGHSPSTYAAVSRGKAVYEAFLSYSDVADVSFGAFLRMTKVVPRTSPPADDGYGYVRRAYGVNPSIGQRARLKNEGSAFNGREGTVIYPGPSTAYVRLVLDGETHSSNVHPMSVDLLPLEVASHG